jgi:hypothetical protein
MTFQLLPLGQIQAAALQYANCILTGAMFLAPSFCTVLQEEAHRHGGLFTLRSPLPASTL